MDNENAYLLCNDCSHEAVCSLKEKFKRAQNAVENATIYWDTGDGRIAEEKLRFIPFILPVKLECEHYQKKLVAPTTYNNGFFAEDKKHGDQ